MNLSEELPQVKPEESSVDSAVVDTSTGLLSSYQAALSTNTPKRPIDKLLTIPNTKVKISIAKNRITLQLDGEVSGQMQCDRFMNSDIFIVESSSVDKGYGPLLYDLAMETVSKEGCSLVSDRKRVSDEAFAVWKYYYENRPDVRKKELDVGQWYTGNRSADFLENMTEDPSTWPDKSDPIWSLWHGYQKDPEILIALEEGKKLEVRDVQS